MTTETIPRIESCDMTLKEVPHICAGRHCAVCLWIKGHDHDAPPPEPPRPERRPELTVATPDSIAAAKADCARQREEARREHGLEIDDDGTTRLIPHLEPLNLDPLTDEDISIDTRVECAGVILAAIEQFGLPAVLRAVRCEVLLRTGA